MPRRRASDDCLTVPVAARLTCEQVDWLHTLGPSVSASLRDLVENARLQATNGRHVNAGRARKPNVDSAVSKLPAGRKQHPDRKVKRNGA